jgi:uncharacterized protein YggE
MTAAREEEQRMDRGLWVSGTGTATAPRDECTITVGSDVRRPTPAAALAGSAEVVDRMRRAFIDAGVPESALSTSSVSLVPVYDDYPTVAGYLAGIRLTGRTREVGAVGGLLTALVTAGGDAARVHEVSFAHSDPAGLRARAREAAWADAADRAVQLAALAGRELGEVVAVDETAARSRPPGPMRMASLAEAAPAGGVPIDAGEGPEVVVLTVGWSLR